MRSVFLTLLLSLLASRPLPAQTLSTTATGTDSTHHQLNSKAELGAWLKKPAVWHAAIPVGLIGLGYVSRNENIVDEFKEEVCEETREAFPRFHTTLDDYTRHMPIVVAYGLYAGGVKGERGVLPFTIIYGLSHALSTGVVTNLKELSHTARPDNPADFSSFPSAHTAEAFMTATLLYEQFGRTRPWVAVGGYSIAAATGAMRMLNNRHWITDVLAGASVGVLSAEAVWHLYPVAARLLPGRMGQKLLLLPTYVPGAGVGAVLAVKTL
ncbi:phosphatase PAP2 family protein [Hymenobacter taeanensis]|uniref:Phosphatase PAP2 family protein n=1 Tax=Hymenobacter taeanensis TaxID=2735321 RepID=A0A6M6BFN6_9BACT|nr:MULTISPECIES: phosphatase PAP2 family protein [Hymenobacter]QJX45965.1 phosphatase PAP2 family protein [Hymenobacter taeanensis]UOQ79812.1 phosphatase PAP2 family protein [Hymenobacter sp. 5414T-23]